MAQVGIPEGCRGCPAIEKCLNPREYDPDNCDWKITFKSAGEWKEWAY